MLRIEEHDEIMRTIMLLEALRSELSLERCQVVNYRVSQLRMLLGADINRTSNNLNLRKENF